MAILSFVPYAPPGPAVSLQHFRLTGNELRHKLRPNMEGEAEAVEVPHILDPASRV